MLPYLLRKHGLTEAEASALAPRPRLRHRGSAREDGPHRRTRSRSEVADHPHRAKLAALNYGTIDAFIPGAEADQALGLVRAWAAEFGEINVGDGPDPIISATLSGVDYDSILERVATEDNQQTAASSSASSSRRS